LAARRGVGRIHALGPAQVVSRASAHRASARVRFTRPAPARHVGFALDWVAMNDEQATPRRIGYAPGVYDLFHVGHLNILRHARAHCDVLVVGVVSDENAFAAKGRAPVIPLAERLEIVRSLAIVDEAVA